MNDTDSTLRRLLNTAAQARIEEAAAAVPFGFETRVVALWRASTGNGSNGVVRLVHRVAVLAAFVILLSSAASFHELQATRDIVEPAANDFAIADTAIADSAIQSEFDQ